VSENCWKSLNRSGPTTAVASRSLPKGLLHIEVGQESGCVRVSWWWQLRRPAPAGEEITRAEQDPRGYHFIVRFIAVRPTLALQFFFCTVIPSISFMIWSNPVLTYALGRYNLTSRTAASCQP